MQFHTLTIKRCHEGDAFVGTLLGMFRYLLSAGTVHGLVVPPGISSSTQVNIKGNTL